MHMPLDSVLDGQESRDILRELVAENLPNSYK